MTLQDWFKMAKLGMLDLSWVDKSAELCYFAFVTNALMCTWNKSYVRTAGKLFLLLSIVWFSVACYAAVPRLAGLQAYEFVPGFAQCPIAHLSKIGKTINYSIVLIFFFLTPLIATLFSYTRVAKVIRQHNINASSSLSLHEIKLSKSLFAIVFAFMICWIPFWVIIVLRRFRLVATMPRSVELLCMFLLYLSNTINLFIYAGMNPVFRREFQNILFWRRNRCNVVISTSGRKETTTNWYAVSDASSACHVSILLFLNFLPVCPFLKKLNLAVVILTSKWFEISILQVMYEMNSLYDMNLCV